MKKIKHSLAFALSLIMAFSLFSYTASATEVEDIEQEVITLTETRSTSEQESLKEIYEELFPDEYHYIVEYEENGVEDLDASEVEMIFYGSNELDGVSYDLIVVNNGQVFMNYSELELTETINSTTITTASFEVGDLGHYNTFRIQYTINTSGYDKINSCLKVTGSGFYLYPTNLSKKYNEDSSGPAHYGYNNVSMNYDGSGVLYDIGVAVGNDKAKGICQVSSGADMWAWAFIYAFFF